MVSLIFLIIAILLLYAVRKNINEKNLMIAPIVLTLIIAFLGEVSLGIFLSLFHTNALNVLLIYSLIISSTYIMFMFEKIAGANINDSESGAIVKIGTMVLSCCIFYSLIYTMIFRVSEANAFSGEIGNDIYNQYISFLYFSVITFTTVGYGDINPVDSVSRLVVVMQIITAFITVVYGLSLFPVFKDHFAKKSVFPNDYKEKDKRNK